MLFQFKKFAINQSRAAMKVGTDGVLLGAWAQIPPNCKLALDIGTGTAVIALMLAQRSDARIDAVENDGNACLDAAENIAASPWGGRISLYKESIQQFSKKNKKYDLIISNPPFFKTGVARNSARHTLSLSHVELLRAVDLLLSETGIFCVVLPFKEGQEFLEMAQFNGFVPEKITQIKPRSSKAVNRLLIQLSRNVWAKCSKDLLIIREGDGYSAEYLALTDDFYLGLQ